MIIRNVLVLEEGRAYQCSYLMPQSHCADVLLRMLKIYHDSILSSVRRNCCYGRGRDDKGTCVYEFNYNLPANPLWFIVPTPWPLPAQPQLWQWQYLINNNVQIEITIYNSLEKQIIMTTLWLTMNEIRIMQHTTNALWVHYNWPMTVAISS